MSIPCAKDVRSSLNFLGSIRSLFKCKHFLFMHNCFNLPGPPYFGWSRQNLHLPRFSAKHAVQVLHLLFRFPNSYSNYRVLIDVDGLLVGGLVDGILIISD